MNNISCLTPIQGKMKTWIQLLWIPIRCLTVCPHKSGFQHSLLCMASYTCQLNHLVSVFIDTEGNMMKWNYVTYRIFPNAVPCVHKTSTNGFAWRFPDSAAAPCNGPLSKAICSFQLATRHYSENGLRQSFDGQKIQPISCLKRYPECRMPRHPFLSSFATDWFSSDAP